MSGLQIASADGQKHILTIITPGTSVTSAQTVALSSNTVTGDNVEMVIRTPGTVAINGTSSIAATIDAGKLHTSGAVTIG